MLVLAILGLLAAASPADTSVRVPGTTLRFGLTDAAVSARGFGAASPGTRKGHCRFFGLASDATLTFEDGRLARAEFAVDEASTYEIAYVHDQLTAMGYRKDCGPPTPKSETCDWTARTRVHVEVSGASLRASVVPAGAAALAPSAPRAAMPDTGYLIAQRVLARLRGAPPTTAPAHDTVRAAAPAVVPAPTSVPRDTVRTAAPAVVPAPTPVPRDTARTAAPAVVPALAPPHDTVRAAAPAGGVVPVLPETLAVSVPGRASRYAPATLLGEPRCDYPEAARAAGVQGRVWVLAFVDTDGRVIRAQIQSGIPVLNAAALDCVRNWSFRPVAWKGAPCRYRALVPVTFTVQ